MSQPPPLIAVIEGADQDDRGSLWSAWARIQQTRPQRVPTDLHVRELIFYVYAKDASRSGVQLSAHDIATRLECRESTARHIVRRATNEFRILTVIEDRYVSGGQTKNRYSVDWAMVSAINRGQVDPADFRRPPVNHLRPPVNHSHGPVNGSHGPVNHSHPFKEHTRTLTRIHTTTTAPTSVKAAEPHNEPGQEPWDVVSGELISLGMVRASDAITAARSRELSVSDVRELMTRWERLRARQRGVTVAWLYRWLTGQSCPPDEPDTAPTPHVSLTSETTRWEMIRSRIVRSGRQAGRCEPEIERRVEEARQHFLRSKDAKILNAPPPDTARDQHPTKGVPLAEWIRDTLDTASSNG